CELGSESPFACASAWMVGAVQGYPRGTTNASHKFIGEHVGCRHRQVSTQDEFSFGHRLQFAQVACNVCLRCCLFCSGCVAGKGFSAGYVVNMSFVIFGEPRSADIISAWRPLPP